MTEENNTAQASTVSIHEVLGGTPNDGNGTASLPNETATPLAVQITTNKDSTLALTNAALRGTSQQPLALTHQDTNRSGGGSNPTLQGGSIPGL